MYVVVDSSNVGIAKVPTMELAKALAKDVDGYVKLFSDWKGPNKASFS